MNINFENAVLLDNNTATDLFANKPMTVKNGKVTVYLTKNGCAWIGVQKNKE